MVYNQNRYGEARYGESGETFAQVTTDAEIDEGPPRPVPEESLGAGVGILPIASDSGITTQSERTSGLPYDFFATASGDLGYTTGFDEFGKDMVYNMHPVTKEMKGEHLTQERMLRARHRLETIASRDERTAQLTYAAVSDGTGEIASAVGNGPRPPAQVQTGRRRYGQNALLIGLGIIAEDDEYHEQVLPLTTTSPSENPRPNLAPDGR